MSEREWKSNVALLLETQRSLRQPLASLPAANRHKPLIAIDKGVTRARLITGIAMHDVYQAAQISLLKRMRPHEAAEHKACHQQERATTLRARSPIVDHSQQVTDIHHAIAVDVGWARPGACPPVVDHRKQIADVHHAIIIDVGRARRG